MADRTKPVAQCECDDPGCPEHPGAGCTQDANHTLRRIDLADDSPIRMCDGCMADALESGVFTNA